MRRADRLFQIVQHLRARRLTTAQQLASWLEVSRRTTYRDIQDLSLSGVPIEGEAGSGYRMSREFEVRPIMFTFNKVEALVTGLRMVESWAGQLWLAPHVPRSRRSRWRCPLRGAKKWSGLGCSRRTSTCAPRQER